MENKYKKTSISLPVDVLEKFDDLCTRNGYTRSILVAQLMRQYIETESARTQILEQMKDPETVAKVALALGLDLNSMPKQAE